MTLTASDVHGFLAEPKTTPAGAMRWTERSLHVRMCRVPLEVDGARVGELLMIVNVALPRAWNFKVMRRGEEVLRWDFACGPCRHRNRKACVEAGLPKIVQALEQEHLWRPGAGMSCAEPLPGEHSASSHQDVLDALCRRAMIKVEVSYEPPPATGEQLTLDEEP